MKYIMMILGVTIGVVVLAQFVGGLVAIAIGALVLVVWQLMTRGRSSYTSELEGMGLTEEEADGALADLERDDKSAVVERIEAAQERFRSEMLKEGLDVSSLVPFIGQQIKWADVIRQVFRVLEFDRSGTSISEDGSVQAASKTEPYGYLLVESPILNVKARLPICHRDDFALATFVFDAPEIVQQVGVNLELLVTYYPKHKLPMGLGGISHSLHYVLAPPGTLERYYDYNDDEHMKYPAPEKLFKEFVWDGMLRVQVNEEPES